MSGRVLTPDAAIIEKVIVGISLQTLYRLCREGSIPCRKVGRRYLISEGELQRWAASESSNV